MADPAQIDRTNTVPKSSANGDSRYRVRVRRGERIRLEPHPDSPDPNDGEAVRRWLESRPRPWAVDLFCGAGGLSLGLEDEGFSVVAATDSDAVFTETHAANIQSLTWTGDLSNPDGFINQLDEWESRALIWWPVDPPVNPSQAPVPLRSAIW